MPTEIREIENGEDLYELFTAITTAFAMDLDSDPTEAIPEAMHALLRTAISWAIFTKQNSPDIKAAALDLMTAALKQEIETASIDNESLKKGAAELAARIAKRRN